MRSKTVLLLALIVPGLAAGAGVDRLIQAITANNTGAVRQSIESKAYVNARGDRATTPLMYAAAYGSIEVMRLLVDAGADVNAKNAFDATALMWCITDPAKVKLLLAKGADVNVTSKTGGTPLLLASLSDGTGEIVRLLLDKGADATVHDHLGRTMLIAAAWSGNLTALRLGLEKHLDVDARDIAGSTALMNAAGQGSTEAVRLLLAAGAGVNAVSAKPLLPVKNGTVAIGFLTPLLLAAAYGPPPLVKALLDAGANVDARDARGMNALHFAVSSEVQDPAIVRMLLDRKADADAKMETGETPRHWAAKFANPAILTLLDAKRQPLETVSEHGVSASEQAALTPRGATVKSLALLEKTSASFFQEGGCVSCHNQNIASMAAEGARKAGLSGSSAALTQRVAEVKSEWTPQTDALLLRMDPPGASDQITYALFGLAADGYAPDLMTASMARNIAAMQTANGSWHDGGLARVPIEDSDITRTAMAIRCLSIFELGGTKAEYAARIHRARRWLLAANPVYSEESNMKLLGLKWAGADAEVINRAAADVVAGQRASGGWAQNPRLPEDAYATSQSLYALHQAADLPVSDPIYRKGAAYLVKTQMPDGSWHVRSRAAKFQPYFQSGFPHDHDQWISAAGTAWAVMALAPVALP